MSTIVFVSLPQPGGRVSVLVVPRLTGSLTEGGMADWAADLAAAELELVSDPGGSAPVRLAAAPDPQLWRSVFPATTPVVPFAPVAYEKPRVEPSASLHDRIGETYANSAKAVAAGGAEADARVREQLATWDEPDDESPAAPVGTGQWVEPDFHRSVSLLREHPAVLRALGLIFDIEPPAGIVGAGGRLRVRWPSNPAIVSPWTAYERTDRGLVPKAGGDVTAGMVDLGTPDWAVASVDILGGAGRLRDAARAVAAGGDAVTLPTLRSQGMSLLRRGRADALEARRTAAAAHGADLGETTFAADDLVLGYRVDIRRQGSPWRSVTARLATYQLNGMPVGQPQMPDDGHVKPNAVVREDDGTLRADEVVARWDGWSLAVPRTAPGTRNATGPRLPLPFDFVADLAVERGTLPSLRFGEEYRMRVRVADLAGGGHAVDSPEADSFSTDFTTYRRYEPIGAPLITLDPNGGDSLAAGEGVEELVIRSDRGLDVAAFAAQHPQYPTAVTRQLAPPVTSLRIAEEHGALDHVSDEVIRDAAATGTIVDPAAGGVLLTVRNAPGTVAAGAAIDRDWSGSWPALAPKSLTLSAPEGTRPRIEWEGEVARLRLGPAEQLTLDISSFFADGVATQFEISEWLRELPTTAITTGRHPMATPPRPVRFVHAVRKPRTDPAGTLQPQRTPSATHAILAPSTPTLGVDVASTAQVDLDATWQEWRDAPEPTTAVDTIPSLTLELGAPALPEIRHEFADTKHRRVTYHATAVSRFRRYFDADEPAEAFIADATLAEVRIPSSVRPPRPLVRAVTPAFRWTGTDLPTGWTRVERRRAGGILRVELARPWFETGQGEQLAVMVWDSAGPPPANVDVTRTGRDAIRATTPLLSFPPLSVFADPDGAVFRDQGVTAVPYDVWFADDRWWADVPVPGVAAASYSPLVQLVVARYQADSLDGLRLSEPVKTDPAPVLPDRTLVVERGGGTITATLQGLAPTAPGNTVHVSIERADVAAGVEAADPLGSGEPAWRPVQSSSGAIGTRIQLALPADGAAHRLVVRETEDIPGDEVTDASPPELVSRTVFVDVIALG
ncbi:hypothetical protein AAIB33_11475 [Microbacterium sp. AZCO]|uniref:hypothetical protein n=1 Tax=Microbacterium sp. AZCO TaxID=3142976 RepID=UPI0031F43E1D